MLLMLLFGFCLVSLALICINDRGALFAIVHKASGVETRIECSVQVMKGDFVVCLELHSSFQ